MVAAHELAKDRQVVLFEAEQRLGGHARTRMAGKHGRSGGRYRVYCVQLRQLPAH